jgi:hypothetical protein
MEKGSLSIFRFMHAFVHMMSFNRLVLKTTPWLNKLYMHGFLTLHLNVFCRLSMRTNQVSLGIYIVLVTTIHADELINSCFIMTQEVSTHFCCVASDETLSSFANWKSAAVPYTPRLWLHLFNPI